MICCRRRALRLLIGIAAASQAASDARPSAAQSELVLYKEGTGLYHWPGCPMLRDLSEVLALTRAQAEARGYKPHSTCDPANAPETTPGRGRGRVAGPVQPPATVYVDGPKYYHRKTCAKLDQKSPSLKAIALETAAKSHWPCPVCKPPIFKRNIEPAIPGTKGRRGG